MKYVRSVLFPVAPLCLLLLVSTASYAKGGADRTQFNRDIHVQEGETTGDLTCINCSIYVRGQAAGDVTAFHGNVTIETGANVAGDVTAIWGNVRDESGTQFAGDLTAIAGAVRRDPEASVAGDVTALQGTRWVLAIILPPLIFFGVIVALIVFFVVRSGNRRLVPAYVQPGSQANTRA